MTTLWASLLALCLPLVLAWGIYVYLCLMERADDAEVGEGRTVSAVRGSPGGAGGRALRGTRLARRGGGAVDTDAQDPPELEPKEDTKIPGAGADGPCDNCGQTDGDNCWRCEIILLRGGPRGGQEVRLDEGDWVAGDTWSTLIGGRLHCWYRTLELTDGVPIYEYDGTADQEEGPAGCIS